MQERRRLADVDLIPQVTQAARVEIARDERRLARARRCADPDDRARERLIEQSEQARTRERVVQARPGELGESGRADSQRVAVRIAKRWRRRSLACDERLAR